MTQTFGCRWPGPEGLLYGNGNYVHMGSCFGFVVKAISSYGLLK